MNASPLFNQYRFSAALLPHSLERLGGQPLPDVMVRRTREHAAPLEDSVRQRLLKVLVIIGVPQATDE